MATLDLSGLDKWPEEKVKCTHELLMEYHDIFSLDNNKLGCASQVKHSIKVTNNEPFREQFRHILPPLLEEVRTHVNDTLQAGAIQPSSSPWCNAVILIWKKDSGLCFCIDFRKLNTRTKKDSYPLPHIQETLESLEGSCTFSSFDFKLVSGRWRWMRQLSSTLPLQWGHWVSLSVSTCLLDYVMHLQPSKGQCKIV